MCAVTAAELNIRITTVGAAQAKAELAGVGDSVRATAAGVIGGAAMMDFGKGLLDMTKQMAEAGASYQQEMQFINALAGGTAQTAQMLQDEALKLDRTTVFSAQDIAAGMEQLAREGFTPLQIAGTNAMNSLIQNASNMAAALKISMPDAANMLGMTMRAFQIDVSQTAATTDILTEAALRSGKSASEFNTQLQYVEATAHQLGIPLTDISAAVGELMSQNVPGAGQGLRAFLVGVTSEGSKASDELHALGISAYDTQGNFIGLGPLIDQVNQALKGLTPAEQSAAIKALSGGNRQVTALIQLLRDGSTGLTDFETKMGTLGGAAHVMSTLMDTAAGSLKAFFSSLETAKILIGESFLPLLKPVTDGLREVLGAFIQGPAFLHAFAAAAIAVTGALFTLAGAVAIFTALDMGAAIGSIVAALGAVAAPLALAAAAIGALYLAYRNNFLGFGDTVNGVIDKFQQWLGLIGTIGGEFGRLYTAWRDQGYGPISASIMAIADGIREAFGGRAIIDTLNNTASQASHVAQRAVAGLLNAITGDFNSVLQLVGGSEFGQIGDTMANALAKNFGLTLKANIPQSLKDLGASFADFGNLIAHPVQAMLDFANLLTRIAVGINTIGNAFTSGLADLLNGRWAAAWLQLSTIVQIATDAFDAVAGALRQAGAWVLNVGIPDVVGDIAGIASAVWDWVQNTAWPAVQSAARTLGGLAIQVGGWLVREGENLSAKVWSWITDTLWPGVQGAAASLGGLAISVYGWLVREGESLSAKVWSWITDTLWPAVQGVSASLGGLAISVGGWLVREGESLSAKVWSWITDTLWPGVKGVAADLGGIAISVSGWLVREGESLSAKVWSWITDVLWPGVQSVSTSLGGLVVRVGNWGEPIIEGLWDKVSNAIQVNWQSISGTPVSLPTVDVNVGKFKVHVDASTLWADVNKQLVPSPADLAKVGASGRSAGGSAASAYLAAFAAGFSLFKGGGGLGGGDVSGILSVPQTWFDNFRVGVENRLKSGFANWHIQVPEPYIDMLAGRGGFAAGAANPFQVIQTQAELQGLKLADWFKNLKWTFSLPKINITPPSAGDLSLIPGVGPIFAQAIGQFSSWVNGLKFSVSIPKPSFSFPSIGLPDFGGVMAGLASGLGGLGNWFKGLKASFDFPKPSFNWPSIDIVGEAVKHYAGIIGGVIHVPIKFVIDFIQGGQPSNPSAITNNPQNKDNTPNTINQNPPGVTPVAPPPPQTGSLLLDHLNSTMALAVKLYKQFQEGAKGAADSMLQADGSAKAFDGSLTLTQQALGSVAAHAGLSATAFAGLGTSTRTTSAGFGQLSTGLAGAIPRLLQLAGDTGMYTLAADKAQTVTDAVTGALQRVAGTAAPVSHLATQLGDLFVRAGVVAAAQGLNGVRDFGAGVAGLTRLATGAGTGISLLGAHVRSTGDTFGGLGRSAAAAAGGIGTFASRATASAAGAAAISAATAAAGRAIGQFATQSVTGAAQVAAFAARLASVRSQVTSFTSGLTAGMNQAVAAVTSGGAAIRAAAQLIGLSLGASGRTAGQQFAQGLGLGALQAAADMAQAAAAIMAVANQVAAQLGAAGTSGGLAFAVGIGMGALQAAADMAGAGAAIEGIANSITGALSAAGAAAGASFAAGIAAGMAMAEGAAAAGVGAIIAICSGVDLFGPGFATGASFGAGVAAGLASEEGAVAAEAAQIVATAAAASAAAAQIHSPSRLFFGQGVQWGLGLAGGAKSTAQLVATAIADLVRLPTLPTLPSSGFAGAGASGGAYGASGSVTIDVGGVHVHVDGGQTHDVNALAVAVTEKIGPVLEHIANRQRRGQGVWR